MLVYEHYICFYDKIQDFFKFESKLAPPFLGAHHQMPNTINPPSGGLTFIVYPTFQYLGFSLKHAKKFSRVIRKKKYFAFIYRHQPSSSLIILHKIP
jgi:hypothetical protein